MRPPLDCQHCGHPNPEEFSFCERCEKFLRSDGHLRGLVLAFAALTLLSALTWGAALYAELSQ